MSETMDMRHSPERVCGDTAGIQLDDHNRDIAHCSRCPRLVTYRERVALERRAAFRDQPYWGRPVPGFGDARARIFIIGLAPAAHGGNRTGRVFTGDRSGDFLYAALHRAGYASQALSISRDDGLALRDVYIAAAARCAPPDNKPTPSELDACRPYLARELELLSDARVILALGHIAFTAALRALADHGCGIPHPRPAFQHAGETAIGRYLLLGCYHPSQRNTSTGLVTPAMYDAVLQQVSSRLSGR
jgi:uracil-DNA glycosylase family 4